MDFLKLKEQQKGAVKSTVKSAEQVKAVGTTSRGFQMPQQTVTDEEKELNKLLHRPRSRKFSKAIKDIDIPSAQDEILMERMKQEMNTASEQEMTFQQDDMEAFRKRLERKIAEDIAREEEERCKQEELLNSVLQDIISPCGLTGCVIHAIDSNGEIREHYTDAQANMLPAKYRKARAIVEAMPKWSYVEIYRKKLVHRNEAGDTIKVYDIEEE